MGAVEFKLRDIFQVSQKNMFAIIAIVQKNASAGDLYYIHKTGLPHLAHQAIAEETCMGGIGDGCQQSFQCCDRRSG